MPACRNGVAAGVAGARSMPAGVAAGVIGTPACVHPTPAQQPHPAPRCQPAGATASPPNGLRHGGGPWPCAGTAWGVEAIAAAGDAAAHRSPPAPPSVLAGMPGCALIALAAGGWFSSDELAPLHCSGSWHAPTLPLVPCALPVLRGLPSACGLAAALSVSSCSSRCVSSSAARMGPS